MENRTFYNEILTDHNLHPLHKEKLPDANLVLEGVNPSCGDDIILQLKVEDGQVVDGAFEGSGCAIFFAKWWLLMLAVLAFLKIGSQVYGNTPQGRIEKEKIMLSLPLVGAINQMNGAAQFANTMSVLLAAGITINQAVDTTAKVMDNALLSEDVRSMREGIERGRSLVECLQGKKYFPPTMVDMCSVGEETGELEETLDNVADYYANEADYRIQRLLALLEPTMLVVLAIFAGIIVVSIYLPIFTMYDLM